MKQNKPIRFICGINPGESKYTVNGVQYIVSSRFCNWKDKSELSLPQRFERIISGNVVPLYIGETEDRIAEEYVCSTAGEEDN